MVLAKTGSKLALTEEDKEESIEDLVRKLVRKIKSNPAAGDPSSSILGDVDGFHYTLLRCPRTETCHLSPREKEIVSLVADGLPNKCIGAVLEISSWTVATHVRRVFSKLGVTSRAAMVARLMKSQVTQQNGRSDMGSRSRGLQTSFCSCKTEREQENVGTA